MIYDVLTNFDAGNVKYDKDTTDPRVPIEDLSRFYNNKIKIETTKIKDMEKALSEYATITDDVLGIEAHNEDQYNRMKDLRVKMGISDDIYPTDIKDLSNTAKLSMAKSKIKRYLDSPEMKMILEEQKKGNDYRSKANEIMSMNEPLGILAMKDYLEKYGNKSEKSYSGFELNINDYVPMDVDAEMKKLAEDIEREFVLEKDPNSPTGDGYLFINKNSQVTENGRAVFERKINALKNNKRFDNNMKSYIAMNSKDTDYNDPQAYNDFISEMMETHLGDKVVSTEVKKIDAKVVLGESGGSGSGKGGSSTSVYDGLKTEHERDVYRLRSYLESMPDLKDYDFDAVQTFSIPKDATFIGVQDEMVEDPNNKGQQIKSGRKKLVFKPKEGSNVEIPINKLSPGQQRKTLEAMEQQQQASSSPAPQPMSVEQQQAQKQDVTINNPVRAKAVTDLGLKKNSGAYMDSTWVYRGDSGKVVMIPDAVPIAQQGFNVKTASGQKAENYHLARSTANKAKPFVDSLGDYEITEAGTDTVRGGHNSPKHYDGTTFDLALRGSDANDPDRIFDTILKAKSSGFVPQFETNDLALSQKINAKINAYNARNVNDPIEKKTLFDSKYKNHFSIYDNEPIDVVKEGQVPALDVASPNNNSDYNEFVKANNLKNRSKEDVVEFNAKYLQANYKPIYEKLLDGNDKILLGDAQSVMSIISQSKTMADYMNKNSDEVSDILKFIKNTGVQDQLMDSEIENTYNPIIAQTPNSKFNDAEKMILLHVSGVTGGKEYINGKRQARTGYELLEQYGFIDGDEYNPDDARARQVIAQLNKTSQQEASLFKLALKRANGEVNRNTDPKEIISLIETEGQKYPYGAVNSNSTAVGRYQFMWSDHKDRIKKLLEGYIEEVDQNENIDVPLPIQNDSISGSNNNARFGIN